MKATALAHPNSAVVKYWGCSDPSLVLPLNSSASITIGPYGTRTTVEFSKRYAKDVSFINGQRTEGDSKTRIDRHLGRIRDIAGVHLHAKVVSINDFPAESGFGSSASGFAALTLAATRALGRGLTEKDLSIIARQGSGSASRSVVGGFSIWEKGTDSEDSYSYSIAGPKGLDMRVLMASVGGRKGISSTRGMSLAGTSPLMRAWLATKGDRMEAFKEAVKGRDIARIGEIAEAESLCLHAICMTSTPPIVYWTPTTLAIMGKVMAMRDEGIDAFYSVDAGAGVYVYVDPKNESQVAGSLETIDGVEEVFRCEVAAGAKLLKEHLF